MTGARLDGVDAEREAQLLSRVIDTISGGLDLGRMLQGVARLVTETTGTDVCFVHLLDERGRTLRLQGATPPFDTLVGKIELGLGEGVSGWVASHGEPAVIVDDKTADPRYRYIPALRGEEFTSMASVPIVTPLGHLVGVLNVHTRLRREFTAADTELLRSVAGLVAGAIENARLHRRLAEREEALEQFAEQTVEWQEHERRRLAGEIHDGISQRIVSLFFHLSAAADAIPGDPEIAAEQVALAQELATAALDETRSAIAGLRPPILDDLGLAASLESLGHSFPQLDVQVEATRSRMAEHIETAVYRTAQEALQNVAKHANARQRPGPPLPAAGQDGAGGGRRRHWLRPGGGHGRHRARPGTARRPGFGLAAMRERAELLGGKLELASSPERGTTVRLTVPLSPPLAGLAAPAGRSAYPGGLVSSPRRAAPAPAAACRVWPAASRKTRLARTSAALISIRSPRAISPAARDQPPGLAQPQPVDRVADAARVGEPRLAHPEPDVLRERLPGGGGEPVLLALQHLVRDLQQLAQREVGEVDVMGDPRGHARVGPEEGVHPVGVAGQDHHQVLPVRLHELQQDLDRLLAVVALVLRAVQVVRLVDEEHPAHRAFEHLLGLRGGVAHVLADQVVPGDADQLALAQVAELAQQLAHVRGHGRLARAGAAGEAHVQARPRRGEPVPAAGAGR